MLIRDDEMKHEVIKAQEGSEAVMAEDAAG
jgi:hypothetical protein